MTFFVFNFNLVFIDQLVKDNNMKTTYFGCGCFVIIFVLVPSLFMFIGGAISYHSERIKEKTYVISQCRVIEKSTKAKTCYRTTYSGYGRFQTSKFSSIYRIMNQI
jgi:hypothetical protein